MLKQMLPVASTEADLFRILGVETRVRLIELLKEQGPFCVGALAKRLGVTPSAVSQHLRILRHVGLVRSERRGYWIHYEVDRDVLEQYGGLISEVCRCGCAEASCDSAVEDEASRSDVAALRKRKKRLERELAEVERRLAALEEK